MMVDNTDLGTDTDLGTLVTRTNLPATTGMDALEARLIVVQEVPPKAELRFFAVRGEVRDLLSSKMALAAIRDHVPRKPLGEMQGIELLTELSVLRDEVDRMRPVYEAAKEFSKAHPGDTSAWTETARLLAIGALLAVRDKLLTIVVAAVATEDP